MQNLQEIEEIKKELTELKVLVSKLLEIKFREFDLRYGWMNAKEGGTTNRLN